MPRLVKWPKRQKREKTAFMFPGQGFPVSLGLGGKVNQEILASLLNKAGEVLNKGLAERLSLLIVPETLKLPPDQQKILKDDLEMTNVIQLVLFLLEYAEWVEISNRDDFRMPDFLLGHSLGECVALVASGIMTFEDGLRFVYCRGNAMQKAIVLKKGGMVAVVGKIEIKKIEKCFKGTDVETANYNSPSQVVISGGREELAVVKLKLKKSGFRVMDIPAAGAFHNPKFMGPVKDDLVRDIEFYGIQIRKSVIPVIFNYTGDTEDDPKRIKNFITEQPINTVRWEPSIQKFIDAGIPRWSISESNIGGGILTRMLGYFPDFDKLEAKIKRSMPAAGISQ